MPSFFIFLYSVERFIPRRVAAPFGPPNTQPVSRRTPRMCSRSASARVAAAFFSPAASSAEARGEEEGGRSPTGTWSERPGERMTARSITFCSSRTLPGQG